MTAFEPVAAAEMEELGAPPSWLAKFGAAVARFLGKMAFYAVMFGLGAAGMVWLAPMPPPDKTTTLGDLVTVVSGFCALIMFFVGLAGMGFTVATGGRKLSD